METTNIKIPSEKDFISKLFNNHLVRYACLENIAEAIKYAHLVAPSKWGLTVRDDFLRLNFGMIEIIAKYLNGNYYCVLDKPSLPKGIINIKGVTLTLENKESPGEGVYKSVPGSISCHLEDHLIKQVLPMVNNSQRILIENAGKTRRHPVTKKGHTPSAVDAIASFIGCVLPHPEYEEHNS
jgi:hypothetical protein